MTSLALSADAVLSIGVVAFSPAGSLTAIDRAVGSYTCKPQTHNTQNLVIDMKTLAVKYVEQHLPAASQNQLSSLPVGGAHKIKCIHV